MGRISGLGVCAGLFLSTVIFNTAFAQLTDNGIYVPPQYQTLAPPDAGQSYVDPVFGTTIKRMTGALAQPNAESGGTLTFITDEYSTMSPFNLDNSRVLVVFQSYFSVYDGDGKFLKNLPFEISASSEPRWSRSDANILYYVHGNQLKRYNVASGEMALVHAFPEYGYISGKGESDICFDGNHFVLAGDNRYVFVYDLGADVKGPALDAGGRGFDSIYITPNDNVTITWLQSGTERNNGIELYDKNMNFQRQVSKVGGHMDVTRDTTGDEILLMTNSADPAPVCNNAIVKIRLADAKQTCLLSLDWNLAVHVSAPDNAGWVFVETYAPADPLTTPAWTAYTNEILQIKLDGTEVRRLAHHRSRPFNSYNYQPHVSVSRDGAHLIYNSNFGLQASAGYPSEYSDVYMMRVPGSATSNTSSNTTATTTTTTTTASGGSVSASTTYEQDNSAVAYTGSWYLHNSVSHSGGSAVLAMDAGSRATFTFSGTDVRWIGYRDEWSGVANVYVDGQLRGSVDTYASPAQLKTVLFSQSGLPAGNHTLTIEVTGNRNAASGGSWVWIDAFDIGSAAKTATKRRVRAALDTPTYATDALPRSISTARASRTSAGM